MALNTGSIKQRPLQVVPKSGAPLVAPDHQVPNMGSPPRGTIEGFHYRKSPKGGSNEWSHKGVNSRRFTSLGCNRGSHTR
jgi:hypothetical protein